MSSLSRLRPLAFSTLLLGLAFLLDGCRRRGGFLFGRSAWGLFILVLDIVAVLDILKQPAWDTTRKLIWMAVIFFLPMLGLLLYYLFSGRQKV